MSIIVQKFGGTSLTGQNRKLATERVKQAAAAGQKVAVVVSAIGRKGDPYATDTLLSLIETEQGPVVRQEQQALLLSCGEVISAVVFAHELAAAGIRAAVLTAREAGIETDGSFRQATIKAIDADRLIKRFDDTDVMVVTGFQGVYDGLITTLGRGGSDTTAAALGSALSADAIYIYTDVEGLMSGDPRIVRAPVSLHAVTYDEACHIAHQGARVIHPGAVEWARCYDVPMWIGPLDGSEGTWITKAAPGERDIKSVSAKKNLAQVTVQSFQVDRVFKTVAENDISIDLISVRPNSLQFTIDHAHVETVKYELTQIGIVPVILERVAKIALIGEGMHGKCGIASTIVSTLSAHHIPILQTADSHMTFWVLVQEKHAEQAQKLLHEACIAVPYTN